MGQVWRLNLETFGRRYYDGSRIFNFHDDLSEQVEKNKFIWSILATSWSSLLQVSSDMTLRKC